VVVADAALGRQLVLRVLGAPAVDHLDRVVARDQERPCSRRWQGLDLFQQAARIFRVGGGFVEVLADLVEEAQVLGHGRGRVAVGSTSAPLRSGRSPACEETGASLENDSLRSTPKEVQEALGWYPAPRRREAEPPTRSSLVAARAA
jgi:hypothetical protein